MTPSEAGILLELPEGPVPPEAVRGAYLRRARAVRLDVDPDGFVMLRGAYELLSRGTGAPPDEVAAMRAALGAQPDSADERWRLLSYFPYGTRPEAFLILCEGAERQPEEFLDELLFYFPERVPAGILVGARDGAGFGRLLLIADVHAVQGRPADALGIFRTALAAADLHSPTTLKLAARPVFSLHEHAQIDAAREALALLKQRAGQPALDEARNLDWATATSFKIADELDQLGLSLPLDLRQVAARAAKRGDFDNTPYEAHFATELLKPREVRKLSARLKFEAPTLAKILGLDRKVDQLNPSGTQDFRIPVRWGLLIAVPVLVAAFKIHKIQRDRREIDQILSSAGKDFVQKTLGDMRKQIEDDCADPNSERCVHWRKFFSDGRQNADGGTVVDPYDPDGGLMWEEDTGTNGTPPRSRTTRRHPVRGHDL